MAEQQEIETRGIEARQEGELPDNLILEETKGSFNLGNFISKTVFWGQAPCLKAEIRANDLLRLFTV